MMDKNHSDCIKELQQAQDTEIDNREKVREADNFLNKRNGQWEDKVLQAYERRPRYTFDEVSPIVDDIMGELQQMDFDIHVRPSGGDAAKDTAEAFEGIIRNVENISNARMIYDAAARIMVGTGLAGWRVVSDYRDDDSFQQDLLIRPIPNFRDCVWFDPNFTQQDASDASFCWVLTNMTKKEYDKRYPEGSGMSVGQAIRQVTYWHKKPDPITIGEYLYKKKNIRELALLSNNAVIVIDDSFEIIRDELASAGITIVKTRKRPFYTVYQRVFDGADWLTDESETPFSMLPIIPVFGNFTVSENKVVYHGCVEKLMDAQRIINYSESRKIEEGALSPRSKVWMTKQQAKSKDVIDTLATLNTNTDPVQYYDFVEGHTPPYQQPAIQSSPALVETTATAQNFIQRSSSTFDEARGSAPAQRSGAAIEMLQSKSDNPKIKWSKALEIAKTQTCRVLIKAIPKVYDTRQKMSVINPDGSMDEITIKDIVQDTQTGKNVEILNLSKGQYDVACKAGPAFRSRQQETVNAINELAAIDPSILQIGADILLNNINSPGIDQIAERKRAQMVQQGMIPPSQLTKEEAQQIAQAQAAQQGQQQQPSPLDQANLMIAQAQLEETQGRNQERALKLQLQEQTIALKQLEMQQKQDMGQQKALVESIKAMNDQVKTQAEVLKIIKDAMGADAIVSSAAAMAYENQARDLNETITQS